MIERMECSMGVAQQSTQHHTLYATTPIWYYPRIRCRNRMESMTRASLNSYAVFAKRNCFAEWLCQGEAERQESSLGMGEALPPYRTLPRSSYSTSNTLRNIELVKVKEQFDGKSLDKHADHHVNKGIFVYFQIVHEYMKILVFLLYYFEVFYFQEVQ